MIPTLLWRCPLCAANDALTQEVRPLRADRLRCRRCRAEWRVRRVPGDNFYLRLVGTGDERSITAWYDAMKATLRLQPLLDPSLALPPDEPLYLASAAAELYAEEGDPRFFPLPPSPTATRLDKRNVPSRAVGAGRLFLTDRRLIWQGEGAPRSLPLARLSSVHAVMDIGLTLLVELRLYTVRFREESLLKWLTYVALVARQIEAETGHRITTSHF